VELGEAEVTIEIVALGSQDETGLEKYDPIVAPYVEFNE
jgi:hypothetical protein